MAPWPVVVGLILAFCGPRAAAAASAPKGASEEVKAELGRINQRMDALRERRREDEAALRDQQEAIAERYEDELQQLEWEKDDLIDRSRFERRADLSETARAELRSLWERQRVELDDARRQVEEARRSFAAETGSIRDRLRQAYEQAAEKRFVKEMRGQLQSAHERYLKQERALRRRLREDRSRFRREAEDLVGRLKKGGR